MTNETTLDAAHQATAIALAMGKARDVVVLRELVRLHHDAELDVLRAENDRLREQHRRVTTTPHCDTITAPNCGIDSAHGETQ